MTLPTIHRVTELDLPVRPMRWRFAEARRDEIDAYFAERQREKPELWNGRVLIGRNPVFTNDRLSAEYFETDFASFLAWRDWNCPDRSVFNGFGMGALRSSDGAFVLGEMAGHTANAGQIYFPAGTPDPADVIDGALDIGGSIIREVEEETGLTPADYTMEMHWNCVFAGPAIAAIRILQVDMPAEDLRERILRTLAGQHRAELSAIHLVRSRNDLLPVMPRFVTAFLERQFPKGGGKG